MQGAVNCVAYAVDNYKLTTEIVRILEQAVEWCVSTGRSWLMRAKNRQNLNDFSMLAAHHGGDPSALRATYREGGR
jgi:hypothetical protein